MKLYWHATDALDQSLVAENRPGRTIERLKAREAVLRSLRPVEGVLPEAVELAWEDAQRAWEGVERALEDAHRVKRALTDVKRALEDAQPVLNRAWRTQQVWEDVRRRLGNAKRDFEDVQPTFEEVLRTKERAFEEVQQALEDAQRTLDDAVRMNRAFKDAQRAFEDAQRAFENAAQTPEDALRREDALQAFEGASRILQDALPTPEEKLKFEDAQRVFENAKRTSDEFDRTQRAWEDAQRVWEDALRALRNALRTHRSEIESLHAAECPNCSANGADQLMGADAPELADALQRLIMRLQRLAWGRETLYTKRRQLLYRLLSVVVIGMLLSAAFGGMVFIVGVPWSPGSLERLYWVILVFGMFGGGMFAAMNRMSFTRLFEINRLLTEGTKHIAAAAASTKYAYQLALENWR